MLSFKSALLAQENQLNIYTYESFTSEWGPGPSIENEFESFCNCNLNFVSIDSSAGILSRIKLEESNVLDLYAGTGSFGLECLSRQVRCVYFVENEKSAFKILEKNIEKLKMKKKSKTFLNDVFDLNKKKNLSVLKFDFIFCDPPFKDTNMRDLIELIFNKNLLKKDGIIILHRNKVAKDELPNFFVVLDERIYGISKIIFGQLLF